MKHILLSLIILSSCISNSPITSKSDDAQTNMSPGTALSDVKIIHYIDVESGMKAKAIVRKTFKYGAGTKVVAPKDTISLLIQNNTYQTSAEKEIELMNKIHTGKPVRMLLKEQEKGPNIQAKNNIDWKVLEIK